MRVRVKDTLALVVGVTMVVAGVYLLTIPSKAEHRQITPFNFELTEYPIGEPIVDIIEVKKTINAPETCEVAFSKEEIDLMARVVMSEASVLSIDAKQAVAQTILNRLQDGRWGNTISEVVYYPNAYSTADNGEPNADCYYAVESAIMYPTAFPTDMFWFRTNYYHSFGYEYTSIGNTFFSTETNHE